MKTSCYYFQNICHEITFQARNQQRCMNYSKSSITTAMFVLVAIGKAAGFKFAGSTKGIYKTTFVPGSCACLVLSSCG